MNRLLLVLLALGLILRLAYGLSLDPAAPYADRGGDSAWYLANGYALVFGDNTSPNSDILTDVQRIGTPPLYLLFLGAAQGIFPSEGAVIAVRVLQALLSTAMIYFLYRMACIISGRQTAGLVAAAITALAPALIFESGQIYSETVYLFFVAAGLWLYLESLHAGYRHTWLIGAGVLLGLATLTRAALLLFPVGLALHLLIFYGWRDGLRRSALLLATYALVVSTWTVYNLVRWDRFVIAGEGFASFLYVGATRWESPQSVDERVQPTEDDNRNDEFLEAAADTIASDPAGYVRRRVTEWASAHLQPHGTVLFSGESLRQLMIGWLQTDRSINGLVAVTQSEAFAPKLALYIFHYLTLFLGVIGVWRTRHRWRLSLPLLGFILYVALLHLVLLALPRYIFPTVIAWYTLAGCAFARTKTEMPNAKAQSSKDAKEVTL